jgi:hypothetical protein
MKRIVIATAMSLCVVSLAGCAADAKTLDPNQIEKQYGVSGALAGGKKGAGVGAAAGGVGGLIYDLLTRDKK